MHQRPENEVSKCGLSQVQYAIKSCNIAISDELTIPRADYIFLFPRNGRHPTFRERVDCRFMIKQISEIRRVRARLESAFKRRA